MLRKVHRHPLSLLVAALLGAGVAAGTYHALDQRGTTVVRQVVTATPARAGSALSVGEIYRRTAGGVVEILATGSETVPFGGGNSSAQGSGFVSDEQGHIVTNEHVVDGADSIRVRFSNGATYKAKLVGSDASTDIAVLKVDAPQSLLVPLAFADSRDVQVGDGVVAIGSPFGLENTVTTGIVSALHREITAPNDFTIADSIQTDAAINHGNSGGPLLSTQGRVIGVTAQIKSDSGGNDGVGFAVPSNTVRSAVAQLIANGKVEHAYLGVTLETIPSDAAAALGVPEGVEVGDVRSGTPAARAGLEGASGSKTVNGQSYATGGDVITRVDGKRVGSSDDLRNLIESKRPGDRITVTYVRDGKEKTATVTLGTRPS